MRLLILAALAVAAPTPAPAPAPVQRIGDMPRLSPFYEPLGCPETPMSLARKRTERPTLRKLVDLPPAEAFAAVDRRIAGCPAPMRMHEARTGRP